MLYFRLNHACPGQCPLVCMTGQRYSVEYHKDVYTYILGPLLFIINNLIDVCQNSTLFLYADDTKIWLVTEDNDCLELQNISITLIRGQLTGS